jgi:multiple sugar transport system ATP-binding protein
MRGELIRLHQEHRTTTLYVTHDQVEAMTLGDRIAVLNIGRLQQVGTPEELYRAPANVFVAGFIGSPSMNLARATLHKTGQTLTLQLGEHRWLIPQQQKDNHPALADLIGHDVVVGLRPSAFSLQPTTDTRLQVKAITVESLGEEKNILFLPPFAMPDVANTAATPSMETELTAMWTAHTTPDAAVTAGQVIDLWIDLQQAYFFNAATGQAIPTTPTAPQPQS